MSLPRFEVGAQLGFPRLLFNEDQFVLVLLRPGIKALGAIVLRKVGATVQCVMKGER
jgi:hypothetical protein